MPTEVTASTICQLVSEEKLGFRFGKPDRPSIESLACILPILRETSQKRQYKVYSETEQVITTDSGSINKVNLKNTSKDNVFIRSGTIFAGKGTQSRALARSAVIFPGQEIAVEVRCVHASHGIRSGSGFEYGGITPLSMDSSFYTSGYVPGSQSSMWANVQTNTATMSKLAGTESVVEDNLVVGASGGNIHFGAGEMYLPPRLTANESRAPINSRSVRRPTAPYHPTRSRSLSARASAGLQEGVRTPPMADNLKSNFDAFAASFDDVLSKARLHDNQVGLGLITDKGCKTIELFDLGDSWSAIHKDSVKRMGTELLQGPDNTTVFEYKPENAINAVRAVLALPFKSNLIYEHKPSNGEPMVSIFGLSAQRYTGEAVELDGRIIHLVLLEMA